MAWPWTEMLLTRHGQTTWNVERRRQGQLDSPLTTRGRADADAVAVLAGDLGVDAIFASPRRMLVRNLVGLTPDVALTMSFGHRAIHRIVVASGVVDVLEPPPPGAPAR